jgi:hypothetical protein
MATYTKLPLSGDTSGAPIKVVATSSEGTFIHATDTNFDKIDEIWLYAYNSASVSVELTVQYGGTTAVNNDIKILIPSKSGLTLVVPGLILKDSIVLAYAGTANVITLSGYVNRIT